MRPVFSNWRFRGIFQIIQETIFSGGVLALLPKPLMQFSRACFVVSRARAAWKTGRWEDLNRYVHVGKKIGESVFIPVFYAWPAVRTGSGVSGTQLFCPLWLTENSTWHTILHGSARQTCFTSINGLELNYFPDNGWMLHHLSTRDLGVFPGAPNAHVHRGVESRHVREAPNSKTGLIYGGSMETSGSMSHRLSSFSGSLLGRYEDFGEPAFRKAVTCNLLVGNS